MYTVVLIGAYLLAFWIMCNKLAAMFVFFLVCFVISLVLGLGK